MGPNDKESNKDLPASEASDDASAHYSWESLHGTKYRDFSASRREYRAPLRHRTAQQTGDHATYVSMVEPKSAPQREERSAGRTHESGQGQATHYAGLERRRSSSLTPASEGVESSITSQGSRRSQDFSERSISQFSEPFETRDSVHAQDDFADQKGERNRPQSVSSQPVLLPEEPIGPAWLYAVSTPQASSKQPLPPTQPSVADTLQQSRERLAARWFALKSAFEQPDADEPLPVRQKETRTPVLAVFSLAGGVGKTSLVATVGRALSSMGEKVLLTDTTSHGLLPFYFGASELRHDTVRTFSAPSGSTDAPIYLVSYEMEQKEKVDEAGERFIEQILRNSQGMQRILLDLTTASSWVIHQMARMNPTVLIPVAPDMNSVISLQFVEKVFRGISDGDGRPLQPFYLLDQFDTSLPLHLDVREVLRKQLGDRLLPFVIRRSPSVSEALAEGMTVVDYAPNEPIAEDYIHVATWLRNLAAPATAGFRNIRWSEVES